MKDFHSTKEDKMTYKSRYRTYENCFLKHIGYYMDDSPTIEVWNAADGPICRLTVCLCELTLVENESFIDVNNNPFALDFICEYGLGKVTGRSKSSGYCLYPSVVFDMEQVEKYSEVR